MPSPARRILTSVPSLWRSWVVTVGKSIVVELIFLDSLMVVCDVTTSKLLVLPILQIICNGKVKSFNTYSYLAVIAGIISEADYVFLPENPPPTDWPDHMVQKLEQASTQIDLCIIHTSKTCMSVLTA